MAVKTGDEFIIRNLTLAGGEINATDRNQSTPLHLATELDLGKIIEILLQVRGDRMETYFELVEENKAKYM